MTLDTHGSRVERRRLMASGALNAYLDWPGLGQVFRVDSWVTEQGVTRHEVRYGITSLRVWEAGAAELLRYVRGHWGSRTGCTGCGTRRWGKIGVRCGLTMPRR